MNIIVIKNNQVIFKTKMATSIIDPFIDIKFSTVVKCKLSDDNRFELIRSSEAWLKLTFDYNHDELLKLPQTLTFLNSLVYYSIICPPEQMIKFQFSDEQSLNAEIERLDYETNKLFSTRVS